MHRANRSDNCCVAELPELLLGDGEGESEGFLLLLLKKYQNVLCPVCPMLASISLKFWQPWSEETMHVWVT